jgi:hypothetical protein
MKIQRLTNNSILSKVIKNLETVIVRMFTILLDKIYNNYTFPAV